MNSFADHEGHVHDDVAETDTDESVAEIVPRLWLAHDIREAPEMVCQEHDRTIIHDFHVIRSLRLEWHIPHGENDASSGHERQESDLHPEVSVCNDKGWNEEQPFEEEKHGDEDYVRLLRLVICAFEQGFKFLGESFHSIFTGQSEIPDDVEGLNRDEQEDQPQRNHVWNHDAGEFGVPVYRVQVEYWEERDVEEQFHEESVQSRPIEVRAELTMKPLDPFARIPEFV